MAMLLHVSFRVKDPTRSAPLYTELLDGTRVDVPPLRALGVITISFGDTKRHSVADAIELWPANLHVRDKVGGGGIERIELDPSHHQPYGHLAVASEKSYEKLAAIAEKHGVEIVKADRGLPYLVPSVYDFDGNIIEFFPVEK